jgi:hypothetical protein
MNDTELDRLLDTWEPLAPPPSLREGVRARFPRAEPRRFARPLGWALVFVVVFVVASAALAIGMEQSETNPWDFRLVSVVNRFYQHLAGAFETYRATYIRDQIRQSQPKVYLNGQLGAPLQYGPAASMDVQVPGDGVYSISSYPMRRHRADGEPTGWVEAGRIHGNVIEFQAGSNQVRIECDKPIVDSDRPVFAMRRP